MIGRLLRRWRDRHASHDIDGLIRMNAARHRPGMERMDWSRMDALGARRAAEVEAAQAASRAPQERPGESADRVH